MQNTEFQRIDKVREMMNFSTFSEMAKELGVSAQVFTDIKKGKHGISKALAEKIAALDGRFSVAWLLTGDGDTIVTNGSGNVTTGDQSPIHTDTATGEALAALRKSQEQIDRLLAIIEKLT